MLLRKFRILLLFACVQAQVYAQNLRLGSYRGPENTLVKVTKTKIEGYQEIHISFKPSLNIPENIRLYFHQESQTFFDAPWGLENGLKNLSNKKVFQKYRVDAIAPLNHDIERYYLVLGGLWSKEYRVLVLEIEKDTGRIHGFWAELMLPRYGGMVGFFTRPIKQSAYIKDCQSALELIL